MNNTVVIQQIDTLRGKIESFKQTKEVFELSILLVDGQKITIESTIEKIQMLIENQNNLLENYIDFTGSATYQFYNDDFEIKLINFDLNDLYVLSSSEISIDTWVDEFVGYGESGWQKIDNPYLVLGDESKSH